MGEWGSGIEISIKNPEDYIYAESARITLKPVDCERIPELKEYLEDLSEITKIISDEVSAKKFIEMYGPGGEKIEPEIKKFLAESGFEKEVLRFDMDRERVERGWTKKRENDR